jgi:hypothetical protein
MFGEHYGSLLVSSGAMVDLENELQSTYMSTKLYQFSLTWNLTNNSKFMENQKKLQLQKLFQITPSFFANFLENFLTPKLFFPGDNSILVVILEMENKLQCSPPVSGPEANVGPTYWRRPPT